MSDFMEQVLFSALFQEQFETTEGFKPRDLCSDLHF